MIYPTTVKNIGKHCYHLQLGSVYYRNRKPTTGEHTSTKWYSPYNKKDVRDYWGKPTNATKVTEDMMNDEIVRAAELHVGDQYIRFYPGETLLAMTTEFVALSDTFALMPMQHPDIMRSGITVHICDVGKSYVGPLPLLITNSSKRRFILRCHRPIISVGFIYLTDDIISNDYPNSDELIAHWNPDRIFK